MADDAQPSPTHESLQKRWHGQDPALEQSGTRQRRRVILYVLIGLFLALASIAVALLLFIEPPAPTPYFLTLNIAEYNARQFPVRPFAQQDVTLLMRHFPANLRDQPVTQSRDLFRKQLSQLKDRPPTPLIVHVASLALVRDDKVYLLPGDADPDDPDSWIALNELIDAVESCPAKKKLLVLDIAHNLVDPRLGVLVDRVAEKVEENLRKTPPSFYVLCSTSAGQWGLSSEALQCSAFAYYLDQGLQGNAAIIRPGFVTVTDLAEFVKLRVDRWARMNRQARQAPVLLGKGVDFTILQLNEKGLEPPEKPKLTAYPDVLQKAWVKRDELRGAGAAHTAPRLLTMLEARLLRRQGRWQGGAGVVPSLTKECDDLVAEMERVLTSDAATPLSLAATMRSNKDMESVADSLLRTLNNQTGAKKIEEELVKKLGADKKADPAQQAWAMLDALYRIPLPTQDQIIAANNALTAKLPYVEVGYLRRLAEFARGEYPETWPPDKARAALLTMRAHQGLLAAIRQEPETLPWMMPAVEEADRLRREGEKKLMSGRSSTWADALKEMQSARDVYERRRKALGLMQASRGELDRAFAELPAYMTLLCDWPVGDLAAEQAWCKAAKEAIRLQAFFANPPSSSAKSVTDLDTGGGELKQALDELDELLRTRIIAAEKADGPAAIRPLQRLIDTPLLKTPKRLELLAKQRELAVKLHEATDALDQEDNQERRLRKPDALKQEPRESAPLRGGMSLALLRLAGIKTGEWNLDCAGDLVLPADQRALLEKELHARWGRKLLPLWRAAESNARGDALNRLTSPWELEEIAGAAGRDCSCLRQAKLRESYTQWLKTCYRNEGKALTRPQDRDARDFFLDAAQGFR